VKYAYLAHDPTAAVVPAGLVPAAIHQPFTAFYVGQLLREKGQPYLNWLERAVTLAPANVDFRYELAAARAATGDVPGAEAAYRELLRLQPWNRRALLNLGYQRLLAGDYAEALRLTRAAQRQDPSYALAYENEANIYLQQGEYAAALRALANLETRFPAQAAKYRALQAKVKAVQ
jgi:tetratricopeptide (TPR) repeat protein